ncbi:hypothetical protein BC332_20455 [Capsicum chinense]|nr:hypothetical protein BC332_20455 [Capsicum chinense]
MYVEGNPKVLLLENMCIPKQFARENGHFDTKERNLIVTDERQRSWNVILRAYHDNVDLRSGWSNIRDANCLKEGDRITFEIVTGGNKPIWKMHRSRPLIGASISCVSSVSRASLDLVHSVCTKYKFRTLGMLKVCLRRVLKFSDGIRDRASVLGPHCVGRSPKIGYALQRPFPENRYYIVEAIPPE